MTSLASYIRSTFPLQEDQDPDVPEEFMIDPEGGMLMEYL